MANTRTASWLKMDADELFIWHHMPADNIKNTAVIIIGPFGPEYMHCFRSTKLLADTVAQAGYHCVRYDPIGMGNSTGNLEDKDVWGKWLKTPSHISQYIQAKYNIDEVILIGLRSGSLILSESVNTLKIKAAIFWYPYTRGAAFVRDIKLLDSLLYKDKTKGTTKILDGSGYPVTDELQTSLNKINILSQDYSSVSKILVINSKETSKKSKLHEILNTQNINNESLFLEGLDAMTKQVAISKIPFDNIDIIGKWIENNFKSNTQAINKMASTEKASRHNQHDYIETIVNLNNQGFLFGILTTPKNPSNDNIVIIPNTGAAHNVGPNRLHTEIARNFAKNGIATLRFDLRNLGESTNSYDKKTHHPYPASAAKDINSVISYTNNNYQYKKITLCGLCSGAHNIFHAALTTNCSNLSKIIIINPLTFYWKPGQSIFAPEENSTAIDESYYQSQMFNYKKWVKLILSPSKMINIARFSLRFIKSKLTKIFQTMLSIVNLNSLSPIEKDFSSIAKKNIQILLIYSKNDPGHKIIMSQASRTTKILAKNNLYSSISINDADHTFSLLASRKELIKTLLEKI